ncbi:hypothetical protein [Leucobacter tenebrionis]|uniref:hypothetical protein n=1 Tax=Leucobacter tenebrionis TaxID=2873270 RepID=UPI001CA75C91|nr:hypothetical protein [Leucobacter tenebrionis]QZY50971.1 hypothetical protein KVY00_10085 [Leucobacter tenebrionis]
MIDVYVIGKGLPELAAALELAEVGLSVRVGDWSLEGSDPTVARTHAERAGGYSTALPDPEGALREFLAHAAAPVAEGGLPHDELRPRTVSPSPVLLRSTKGDWAPQPMPAAMGVPAVPISSQAIALLGGRAAARAYLDRVKPVLTIGKAHSFGELVRGRLGEIVVERLVDPFVRERFGVAADDVEVAVAVPGLNEALTRAGSLSGAVLANADRDVARETGVVPAGGWPAGLDELERRLGLYSAETSEAPVVAVQRSGEELWIVEEAGGAFFEVRSIIAGIGASSTREALSILEPAAGAADTADTDTADTDPAAAGADAARGAAATADVAGAARAAAATDAQPYFLRELFPQRWRIEANAAVVAETDASIGEIAGGAALCTVQLADGAHWAVRIEPVGDGAFAARLSGPVFDMSPDLGGAPSEAQLTRTVAEALAAVRLRPAGEIGAVLRAAPYASIDERDAAETRVATAREQAHGWLVVGEALHGGAVASAVADARTQAVRLRRRLAGIAD